MVSAMLLAPASWAADCAPTPRLLTQNYPGASGMLPGNNLLIPAGKSIPAPGQKLTLQGRLLDSNCVPVAGAVIELWQVNPFGKWILATPADRVTPNATFAGAGRATTDNDGQFIFVTAFPAALAKRAPNLNIKINLHGVSDFATVLYFGGDSRNASDTLYTSLPARDRSRVTLTMSQPADGDGLIGSIDLVLPSRAPYRTY
ncbi:MAG: hypothetical protein ACKVOE_09325 [Rickettsiales bacterium]